MTANEKPFGVLPESGLVRKKIVLQVLGISNSTFWRLQKSGRFPRPDPRFGVRMPMWRSEVVRRWLVGDVASE
ncbi:putative DNA-binding transcriptional regulator AlpA [Rhodanobacter sp. MP1X3]|nr:putative DNA-binding transcriptional regulator AlpA [Rhodanobacter sp. MP1X3]